MVNSITNATIAGMMKNTPKWLSWQSGALVMRRSRVRFPILAKPLYQQGEVSGLISVNILAKKTPKAARALCWRLVFRCGTNTAPERGC